VQLTVKWPDRSRLIPLAANSINTTLFKGETQVGHQLLARPAGNATETTVNFQNVPAGSVTLHADAFPAADGSGIMQAGGSATVTVVAGQTAQVTVTMGSTIARVAITPPNPTVNVGSTTQLTMTAFNQADEIVLTSPSKITWQSGTTANATVNGTGNVTGVAVGNSVVTVTETESGKSATTTVTVTSPGGGGVDLNGKIVFEGTINEVASLVYINPDGTGITAVPNTGDNDVSPDPSPDGTKIAYTRAGGVNQGVAVINANGTNAVTIAAGAVSEPAWSPNGTKIAVRARNPGTNSFDIMVMNADGSNKVFLTNDTFDDAMPRWSPDGTRIVFISNHGVADDIWVMNANGSGQTQLTTGFDGSSPDWSPDGTKIAFSRQGSGQIQVMNADGSNQVALAGAGADGQPSWSPDGTKIVFSSTIGGGRNIWSMNANGTGAVNVTNDNLGNNFSPRWR
jgi:Tol biopolymer transport system component